MSAGSIPGLTLARDPRVQLLPPSVKERERSRAARGTMGLLVVLAIVVAGAGTGFAFWLASQTEARLAEEPVGEVSQHPAEQQSEDDCPGERADTCGEPHDEHDNTGRNE